MELFITFAAGLSVLLGAGIVKIVSKNNAEKVEHFSIAMALAALLSLLIFDLLPEVLEYLRDGNAVMTVAMMIAGLVILIILDKFVPDHEDNDTNHDNENSAHIGVMSALAICIHNVVEGMSIYGLSLSDISIGAIFAVGVALHNIPMGMMIYSTTKHKNKNKLMICFAGITLSTLVGGLIMFALSGQVSQTITGAMIAVAVGMIMYIVFMELLPHVIKTQEYMISIMGALLGFVLVFISSIMG